MSATTPVVFPCAIPGCTFRSVHGSAVEIHAATVHVVDGFRCVLCTDRAPFPSRSSYLAHRTAAHPQLRTFATGSSSSTVKDGLVVSDGRGGAIGCAPVLAGLAVACPCCSQPMAEAAPGVQTHLLTVHGWTDVAAYCCDGASAPACACGKLFVAVNKFNAHVKAACASTATATKMMDPFIGLPPAASVCASECVVTADGTQVPIPSRAVACLHCDPDGTRCPKRFSTPFNLKQHLLDAHVEAWGHLATVGCACGLVCRGWRTFLNFGHAKHVHNTSNATLGGFVPVGLGDGRPHPVRVVPLAAIVAVPRPPDVICLDASEGEEEEEGEEGEEEEEGEAPLKRAKGLQSGDVPCDVCSDAFPSADAKNAHRRRVHPDAPKLRRGPPLVADAAVPLLPMYAPEDVWKPIAAAGTARGMTVRGHAGESVTVHAIGLPAAAPGRPPDVCALCPLCGVNAKTLFQESRVLLHMVKKHGWADAAGVVRAPVADRGARVSVCPKGAVIANDGSVVVPVPTGSRGQVLLPPAAALCDGKCTKPSTLQQLKSHLLDAHVETYSVLAAWACACTKCSGRLFVDNSHAQRAHQGSVAAILQPVGGEGGGTVAVETAAAAASSSASVGVTAPRTHAAKFTYADGRVVVFDAEPDVRCPASGGYCLGTFTTLQGAKAHAVRGHADAFGHNAGLTCACPSTCDGTETPFLNLAHFRKAHGVGAAAARAYVKEKRTGAAWTPTGDTHEVVRTDGGAQRVIFRVYQSGDGRRGTLCHACTPAHYLSKDTRATLAAHLTSPPCEWWLEDGVACEVGRGCPTCGGGRQYGSVAHRTTAHGGYEGKRGHGGRRHACDCGCAATYTLAELEAHRFDDDGAKRFACDVCGTARFGTSALLRDHRRKHCPAAGTRFPCDLPECDYIGPTLGALQQHQRSGVHVEVEKPCACAVPGCSSAFRYASVLARHEREVHVASRDFACVHEDCTAAFKTQRDLDDHVDNVHSEVASFVCEHPGCDAAFRSSNYLMTHVSLCHGDFRLFCDQCEYRCRVRAHLNAHVASKHSDARPFLCEWVDCGASFKRESTLASHRSWVHLQDQEHTCAYCGVCTWSRDRLATHVASMHERPYTGHRSPQEEAVFAVFVGEGTLLTREFCPPGHRVFFDWVVKSPAGGDGKVLVEYDGVFHFRPVNNNAKNSVRLLQQVFRDTLKSRMCRHARVPLVRLTGTETDRDTVVAKVAAAALPTTAPAHLAVYNDYVASESLRCPVAAALRARVLADDGTVDDGENSIDVLVDVCQRVALPGLDMDAATADGLHDAMLLTILRGVCGWSPERFDAEFGAATFDVLAAVAADMPEFSPDAPLHTGAPLRFPGTWRVVSCDTEPLAGITACWYPGCVMPSSTAPKAVDNLLKHINTVHSAGLMVKCIGCTSSFLCNALRVSRDAVHDRSCRRHTYNANYVLNCSRCATCGAKCASTKHFMVHCDKVHGTHFYAPSQ